MNKRLIISIVLIGLVVGSTWITTAQEVPFPGFSFGVQSTDEPEGVVLSVQLLVLLTILTLAPALLTLVTSFTRTVIVLSFVRSAVATNQTPPNQVIIGLALFLTAFVMAPTFQVIHEEALQPYLAQEINTEEAFEAAAQPLRDFMLRNTRGKDLTLFVSMAGLEQPETADDVPTYVLIPAFIISELKTAFQLGFILFIPFIVIDMIVASTLMSMGMLMLPPVMISLPFKILLFVMVDGWHLVTRSLLIGFE